MLYILAINEDNILICLHLTYHVLRSRQLQCVIYLTKTYVCIRGFMYALNNMDNYLKALFYTFYVNYYSYDLAESKTIR